MEQIQVICLACVVFWAGWLTLGCFSFCTTISEAAPRFAILQAWALPAMASGDPIRHGWCLA